MLLNSPSNPSGAAYGEADYRPLLDVMLKHPNVWVMVDDMCEHIVYDSFAFVTPAAIEPRLLLTSVEGCEHILIVDECRRTGSQSEGRCSWKGLTPGRRAWRLRILSSLRPAYAAILPSKDSIVAAALDLMERRR